MDPAWKARVDRSEIDRIGCRTAHSELELSIIPHGRLINLNTADASLLAEGITELGIDPTAASGLSETIVAYRSPRAETLVDDDAVQSGLKRAPFEDLSELYDFRGLQRVSMGKLIRVFSAWSGRSMLSPAENVSTISQHYTAVTRIVTNGARGHAAAVYMPGGTEGLAREVSPIVQDIESEKPNLVVSCDDLFGWSGQPILEGAGL